MNLIIQEKSGLPKFILKLYAIQLLVVSFYIYSQNFTKLSLYLIGTLILIGLVLLVSGLKLEIGSSSIKYSFFPFLIAKREIRWSEIESIQIKEANALSNFLGWGIRYSSKYGWAYITDSESALFITKKNKKKFVLSIENKEEIINFLEKMKIPFSQDS